MVTLLPGTYVLFRGQGSLDPPWPAVICTDDLAPTTIMNPHGFYSLILLIKEKPQFRYVLPTEVTDYDPFPNETDIERAPALVRAHELVSEGMESGDDLKFWKHMTAGQRIDSLISDTGRHSEHGDEDENPRRAIEESLLDASRKRELLPTPSISPPRTAKRQQLQSPTIMDFFSAGKQMPKQLAMRACDIVNGDLSESKEFIEFLVGAEKSAFSVPIKDITRRPYFSQYQQGYLKVRGKEAWSFEMPFLKTVSPDEFQLIAEYLSHNDFGHKVITDDNREEAMAQCIAAWKIGERMGMADILDHIAEKIQRLVPWDFVEVVSFSTIVYQTTESLGHDMMKNLLTDFIVENYYDMIEDCGGIFLKRVQKLPELERDMHKKLAKRAGQKMVNETGFNEDSQ